MAFVTPEKPRRRRPAAAASSPLFDAAPRTPGRGATSYGVWRALERRREGDITQSELERVYRFDAVWRFTECPSRPPSPLARPPPPPLGDSPGRRPSTPTPVFIKPPSPLFPPEVGRDHDHGGGLDGRSSSVSSAMSAFGYPDDEHERRSSESLDALPSAPATPERRPPAPTAPNSPRAIVEGLVRRRTARALATSIPPPLRMQRSHSAPGRFACDLANAAPPAATPPRSANASTPVRPGQQQQQAQQRRRERRRSVGGGGPVAGTPTGARRSGSGMAATPTGRARGSSSAARTLTALEQRREAARREAERNAAASARKSRRRQSSAAKARLTSKAKEADEHARVWEGQLLGRWVECRETKLAAGLCRAGVPAQLRGRAWAAMIGNPLMLTPRLFQMYRAQARRREASDLADAAVGGGDAAGGGSGSMWDGETLDGDQASLEDGWRLARRQLDGDLPRTFAGDAALDGLRDTALRDVLTAFAMYRPDLGYVQGMSYVAANLLLEMCDPAVTFTALANLLHQRVCFDFYRLEPEQIDVHLKAYNEVFKRRLPLLFRRFADVGIDANMYFVEWSLTLFTKVLPLPVARRVWDCYLRIQHGSEAFFMRVALALLRMHAQELYAAEMGPALKRLHRFPDNLDADALLESVDGITLTPGEFEKAFARHSQGGANPVVAVAGGAGGGVGAEAAPVSGCVAS